MSLSSKLTDVLAQRVLEPRIGDTIVLRERDPKSKMEVSVVKLSDSIAAIRLSKFSHLSALREGSLKQVCDYLLVYALNGDNYAVLIELKKTLSNDTSYREQLRRSLPFLEYLRSVCDIEYGNETDHSDVRVRYFCIGEKLSPKFDKQPVKVGPDRIFEPEEYGNITINTLVGPRVSLATLSCA